MTPSHVSVLLDPALGDPALVVGSLPPGGRDLDLLVISEQREALRNVLTSLDFVELGGAYVRFSGRTAYEVEVKTADDWALPEQARDDLWSEARPIEGYRMLLRPSPHHALLI